VSAFWSARVRKCPHVSAKNADVRILCAFCPQLCSVLRHKISLHRQQRRCEQQRHNSSSSSSSGLQCQQRSNSKTAIVKLTTMNHFALHDRRPRKRNGTQDQQKIATAAAAQQAVAAATGKANDALRCSIACCHTPQRDSS
jgi:hypothetical protein